MLFKFGNISCLDWNSRSSTACAVGAQIWVALFAAVARSSMVARNLDETPWAVER